MTVDLHAARRFVYANARLLDTHRAAYAFDATDATDATDAADVTAREPVLTTLAAYRNADGGFGHGLHRGREADRDDAVIAARSAQPGGGVAGPGHRARPADAAIRGTVLAE